MSHHYLPWVVGLIFSVVVGHLGVWLPMTQMRRAVGLGSEPRPSAWQPAAIGLVERTLFTASILAGHAEFIAVWLGIKTVGTFNSWSPERMDELKVTNREIYSMFLLGQGLSIGFGVAGAYATILLEANRVTPAGLLLGATLLGAAAFTVWICIEARRAERGRAQEVRN